MKTFTSAPLPFQGQKRKFIKSFREVITTLPDDAIIIDLFGGSGLLAHTAKRVKPDAMVIYNDFDSYADRLLHVEQTNALLNRLRPFVANFSKSQRLPADIELKIKGIVQQAVESGDYIDWVTLSSNLLFSSKYATSLADFCSSGLYNNFTAKAYEVEGYLDGLIVTSTDYRNLVKQYSGDPRVVFLLDPPYLSTDVTTYTMRWTLSDYLDVLIALRDNNFIYFTSSKSQIIELCEWLGAHPNLGNPFAKATQQDVHQQLNYAAEYRDIMLHNLPSKVV